MIEFPTNIHEQIRNLYEVFRPYRVKFPLDVCDCCVFENHQQQLAGAPLEQLTADELSFYAFKAITTFGTVEDFKHFLPRILEVIAHSRSFPVDEQVVFGKLPYANWRNWPAAEQRAIEQYLRAWWRRVLETPDSTYMCTCLGSIARVVEDLQDFLQYWIDAMDRLAVARIRTAEFVSTEFHFGPGSWPFWEDIPDRQQQVINWLRSDETHPRILRGMDEWFATADGHSYGYRRAEFEAWRSQTRIPPE